MKRVLIAAIALIIPASAALAADAGPVIRPGPFSPPPAFPAEPVVTPGPFEPPPAFPQAKFYNWTGFYLGVYGGGAFGNTNWQSVPDITRGTSSVSGGLVGGTAGYNLQTGDPLVLGVEADFGWSGIKGTVPPASCGPGCEVKDPWLGTVRLRIGYAFDAVMPYVTGGAAVGRFNTNIVGAPFGSESANTLGWTVGAGVEFVITGGLHGKVEYLYVDLNGASCNFACGGGPISFNVRPNLVRAGLSWQFGK